MYLALFIPGLYYTISTLGIWLCMMGVAFLGYVLPWGLMSFWALTVITNLITVLPLVGVDVLYWLRSREAS